MRIKLEIKTWSLLSSLVFSLVMVAGCSTEEAAPTTPAAPPPGGGAPAAVKPAMPATPPGPAAPAKGGEPAKKAP